MPINRDKPEEKTESQARTSGTTRVREDVLPPTRSRRTGMEITSPNEHEQRKGQTLSTHNHDVVRQWAEGRGARPATVPGTEHDKHLGVLTFDFPDYGGRKLDPVDWKEWFGTFDDRKLTFVFQEHKRDGSQSNFFRLTSPEREDG